ncbi:sodium/glucose cotransporter 4-like isoform X2 [Acanthaster planci]|uniref:Sodium/glucose cotransporter 4-like isoform X2 n=1 Tax=Acanthaster planci TaxID=133434 RepID=A0A8B7XHE5_ACAPL|nr:sodium/glucose cotransporter 4-like isoform X2 [Acanthaster planci]
MDLDFDDTKNLLTGWDIAIIVVVFLVVLAVGLWSAWVSNRGTTKGYFLAGRSMSWWLVGLSLYVSNIGSSSFIGLAGTASLSGYAVVSYEFHGLFSLILLGFIFMPVYTASGVSTMPEYLKRRFGGERLRILLSITAVVLIVLTNMSSEMYAGTIIIQQALNWNLYLSVCLLLAMTAAYTIAGGLTAVIYTDALQSFIMIGGATVLSVVAFIEIGGLENLYLRFMTSIPSPTFLAGNTTCGIPSEESWHIFRDATTSDLPWPGVLFGIFLLSAWYFCTNQVLVQRSLSAKNVTHSKAGTLLAAVLKLLPMVLMIYPGMISRALWPDYVACQDSETCLKVCENPNGCSDIAYIRLLLKLMPTGLKGLMMAAMLAALMSSLTSVFNSASSIVTLDLWIKVRPLASETELVIVGRLCTLILAAVSVLWLPLIQLFGSGQLFVYIQSISSYMSPPIFAVYTAGMFSERTTEQGAFWGLLLGEAIGCTWMVLDFVFLAPPCGGIDERPLALQKIHYLHFALLNYAATVSFIVVLSLLTKRIPQEKLIRLTWWTRKSKLPRTPMSKKESKKHKERGWKKREIAEAEQNEKTLSGPRRIWNFVCGIESFRGTELTPDELKEMERRMTSLVEDPQWAKAVNAACLIVLFLGFLAFGLFA